MRSASDHVCAAISGSGTGAASGVAAGGFAAGGFTASGFTAGGFATGGFALRLPTEAEAPVAIERNDASSRSDMALDSIERWQLLMVSARVSMRPLPQYPSGTPEELQGFNSPSPCTPRWKDALRLLYFVAYF